MRPHHPLALPFASASGLALPLPLPLPSTWASTLALALATALALGGCGPTVTGSGCRDDSDCAVAGQACVAGQCRDVMGRVDLAPAGADDGGVDLARPLVDLAGRDAPAGDALAAACNFNGDGVITRAEAPFPVGLGALYAVNAPGSKVAVNLGAAGGAWDFSAAVAGERKSFDQLISPAGAWWAADFPSATYADHLDDNQPILGVYRATVTSLDLLGLVSETNGVTKTSLKYTTPISVLKFPLGTGTTWISESDVTGLASGVFFFAHEKYAFAVDARGMTRAPAGGFDTLRLLLHYTQTYGLLTTTRITWLYLAECYGAVARIRSQDNEASDEFTQAAEYRRLSAP